MKHLLPAIVGLCVLAVERADAAFITYFNDPVTARAAFQGAAGSLTLESFENSFTGGASVTFQTGSPQEFQVSASSGGLSQSSFSRGVSHGSFSMFVDENPPGRTVTFTFVTPITAFGLDVNDLNFASMSFADNLGNVVTDVLLPDNGGPAGGPDFQNLQFFGVTNSNPFSQVVLTFTNNSSSTGSIFLDRLEYGVAEVPEPASMAIFGVGSVGLLSLARRSRRTAC